MTSAVASNNSRKMLLELRVDLKAGDVVRTEHLCKSATPCLADHPITGPFAEVCDLVGCVVASDVAAGTIVTDAYLKSLARNRSTPA